MRRGEYYVNDDELYYHIILSQGKGFLTKEAEEMLLLIVKRFMMKFHYWKDNTYYYDCYQNAVLVILSKWQNFNRKKYDKALPYFSEITKRAVAHQFNDLEYTGYSGGTKYGLNVISINGLDF